MVEYAKLTPGQYCAFKVLRLTASPKRELGMASFLNLIDADGINYRQHIKALSDKGFISIRGKKSGGGPKIFINKDVP